MGAAFDGVDVVGITVNVLRGAVVVLQCDFHIDAVAFAMKVDHIGIEDGFVHIEHRDEFADAALVMKFLAARFPALLGTFVDQSDVNAAVEKRQFAEALGEDVPDVDRVREDGAVGFERHLGAAFAGGAEIVERDGGHAALEPDRMDSAVAVDFHFHPVAEGVDARDADAVESAGYLVGVVVEFSAGVENGEHDFDGGFAFALVNVHRDAAAVIFDGDRIVRMNDDDHV